MTFLAVSCTLLMAAEAARAPSRTELAQAILTNRAKVRSLHVRAHSVRPLQHEELRRELYLDADAGRWRVASTGWVAAAGGDQVDAGAAKRVYRKELSLSDGQIYEYFPADANVVATKETLIRAVAEKRIAPFPDPRNAGMAPVSITEIGPSFERTGGRLDLYSTYVECFGSNDASISSATWKGTPCWKVEWELRKDPNVAATVFRYFAVPEWGFSIVLLQAESYAKKGGAPCFVSSVETEVARHEESGLWFPRTVSYHATVNLGKEEKREEITRFDIVSLNKPIPENSFTFQGMGLASGHTVQDLTGAGNQRKKLWDGTEIVAASGPSPITVTDKPGTWTRWRIIGLAVTFFMVAGFLLWIGFRRKTPLVKS
jgi:hypothetical protein